jgi:hypothetical protein
MKPRLLILIAAVIAFAPTAEACEECRLLPGGKLTCWSGAPEGWDWCIGGFGRPCEGTGDCRDCTQINCGEPESADGFCDNPIAGCGAGFEVVRPAGFMLMVPGSTIERSVAVEGTR